MIEPLNNRLRNITLNYLTPNLDLYNKQIIIKSLLFSNVVKSRSLHMQQRSFILLKGTKLPPITNPNRKSYFNPAESNMGIPQFKKFLKILNRDKFTLRKPAYLKKLPKQAGRKAKSVHIDNAQRSKLFISPNKQLYFSQISNAHNDSDDDMEKNEIIKKWKEKL